MASKMIMSNEVAAAVDEEEEEASGCGSRGGGLKKGPWTTSEDAILVEYVRKHGEGNWNAVQKNSGLARCGKSCRLRWANHLRPNLKKGSFSPEEERIIIELHAKIGNKWARMASQLPGRTDNEIKNYWNTRMKRRQRAGLPLYPHDIQQYQNDSPQLHSSSSSSSFSSQLLSSSHHHHHHSPKPNYTFHPHHSAFHSQPSDSNHLFNGHNGRSGFALPISSPVFTFGSPSSSTSPPPTLFNQSTHIPIPQTTLPAPSFQYNVPAGSFGYNFGTLSSMVTGVTPYDPPAPAMGLQAPSLNMVTELPSTQTTPLQSTTPVSSYTSGCGCGEDEFEFQQSRGNSGLLDALLVESQSLSHNEKTKRKASPEPAPEKAKRVMSENQLAEEEERTIGSESVMKSSGETASTGDENGRTENFSTSSVGVEQSEDPLDVNSMDDDLMSLLNNFPTSMPVPDWYGGGGKLSNLEESGITSGYARRGVEDVIAQDSSLPAPTTTTTTGKHERRSLDSCYWNNMPGIC